MSWLLSWIETTQPFDYSTTQPFDNLTTQPFDYSTTQPFDNPKWSEGDGRLQTHSPISGR